MNSRKFFFVMIGLVCLVSLLLVGAGIGGKTLLQKQSVKLKDLKTQNWALDAQQVSLAQAKKDVEKYQELNNIARSIVPQDKDQAKTVREITNIAEASGIQLTTITFPTSTLGQTPVKAATPESGDKATTPAAPAQPAITQVAPVSGITGVYAMDITISPGTKEVSYRDFISFLERLESNRRTAHVDKITVNPSDDGRSLSFTLTVKAYVKP